MPDAVKTVSQGDINEQREKVRLEARKRLEEGLAKLAPPDEETPEGNQPERQPAATTTEETTETVETPEGEEHPEGETETPEGEQPVPAAAAAVPDGFQEVLVETESGIVKTLIPKDVDADTFKGGYMQRADYNRRVNKLGAFGKKYLRQIEDGTIDTFDPHLQRALRDPEFRLLADTALRMREAGHHVALVDPTKPYEPERAPAVARTEPETTDDDLPSDPLVERALDKRFKAFDKRFERFDRLADAFEQQANMPREQAERQARGEIWAETLRYDLSQRFPQAFKGTKEDDPFIQALIEDAITDGIFDIGPDRRPIVTTAGIVASFRKGTVKPPNAAAAPTTERPAPESTAAKTVAAVQAEAKRKAAEAARTVGARVAGGGSSPASPTTAATVKVSTRHADGRKKTANEFMADVMKAQVAQSAAARK